MAEHDPSNENDRELEDFLARRSELSRLHRDSAQEQAPPELDAKVLETARAELRSAARPRRWLRWDNPLALAASALLVVGLAWLTQRQAPPRPATAEAAPAAPIVVEADQASLARAATEPGSAGELKDELKKEKQPSSPSAPLAAAAKSVAPPTVNLAQPMPRPFPLPQAQKPAAPAAKAAKPQAEDAAGALQAEPAPAAEARDKAELAVTPAPSASPPPPPAQDAMAASQYNAPAAAAPAPALPAMRREAAVDPCASAQRAPAQKQRQPERQLDAPAWLEQVRQLRRTDESAARAELACFSARWPQAEVPEDLRPLLPQR
jgi:hypothetical protein